MPGAASLARDVPVSLGEAITDIDDHNVGLRQIRTVTRQIRVRERALTDPAYARLTPGPPVQHENTIAVLSLRLLHLAAALETLGYTPPPLDDTMAVIARHGLPLTLKDWERGGEVPDGADA